MNTLLFLGEIDFSEVSIMLLMSLLIALVIYLLIQIINYPNKNYPTWTGIIISLLIGMLPLYLFLCFFGIMGDKSQNKE